MKIQNIMNATVFFPYAGVTEGRGKDIKSGEFSSEIDAFRFSNPVMRSDWKAGKIAIILNDADKIKLGEEVTADIVTNSKRFVPPVDTVISPIPAVSEEAEVIDPIVASPVLADEPTIDVIDDAPVITETAVVNEIIDPITVPSDETVEGSLAITATEAGEPIEETTKKRKGKRAKSIADLN